MAGRTFVGIDLGAESGRVVAGTFDGGRIRLDELHRFPNGPVDQGGTLRWDVERLWAEISKGLQAASAFDPVASVGVDSWAIDFGLLSKAGELLDLPYHYRDRRTDGVMARAFSRVPREELFTATGIQFLPFNTLYQLLALKQSRPDLLTAADRLLLIPDLFHEWLCGSRSVEFTNATTTQFFNPRTRNWATDLLDRLNLPHHFLGDVVPPGTVLGQLRDSVATETGLSRIPVVTPASHDTASAVAAVPTDRTGRANWAYISSGTWSLVGVELPAAILSPAVLEFNLTNEGGVDGTFRLLKNVAGLWLVQQCRAVFRAKGLEYDYDRLMAEAAAAPSGRSVIDPDDPRFLNPADMAAEIAAACRDAGQAVPDTVGQIIRCCLDSLALKYSRVIRQLEVVTGERIEVIHVVGGGSKNRLLNQLTADACRRPVLAGPAEATALGNVLIQARAAGEIGSLAEIRAVVQTSLPAERFDPVPES
jgi:rhamnulokinase